MPREGSSPNNQSETARLRTEVQNLQKEKQNTQHQLDKIHGVLEGERKALKDVLAAARQAVDDLKVENLGLTQALATERAARVKDRDAYTAELELALGKSERGEAPSTQGSFDELVRELKALIQQLSGDSPLREGRGNASPAVRPVLTAVRACFTNAVRKQELAEAALDAESIKYEMRLLETEARLSTERAQHIEEIEQTRASPRGGADPRALEELQRQLQQVTVQRDQALQNSAGALGGKSGFVLKKGENTDIWRQRWLVVDDTHIRLFDPQGSAPKTSVHLSKITKVKTGVMGKPSTVSLEIHARGADRKTIFLDFQRKDNAQGWLRALQVAQSSMSAGGSTPGTPRDPGSPGSAGVVSPREHQLETDLVKLQAQAREDQDARVAMARRLETVEDAFDGLANTLVHLESGNWEEARRQVRAQLADLGLMADETPQSIPSSPSQSQSPQGRGGTEAQSF